MPIPQQSPAGTGDGHIITNRIAAMPGMERGEVGIAGVNKPGPSVRTVAVAPALFIIEEVAYVYLHSWLGIATLDFAGVFDNARGVEPLQALDHLIHISTYALAPSGFALLQELYSYLGKRRAARHQR